MSGHSKWANIKHRKGRQDAARGKLFGKLAKAIEIAAREGGGNPEFNPTLTTAIYKAKAASMPNDNIDRAVKRGTGEVAGAQYEEIWYEGYGPGGVALYVQILTDNRNRAASDVRSTFTRGGGNLGEPGSVGYPLQSEGSDRGPRPRGRGAARRSRGGSRRCQRCGRRMVRRDHRPWRSSESAAAPSRPPGWSSSQQTSPNSPPPPSRWLKATPGNCCD